MPCPLSPPLTILMYHQVGHFKNPQKHRAVYCDAGRFARQMAWLYACRYNVLSLRQACDCIFSGKPVPPRAVVLTFDDGCDNFREYAFPVLEKYGFPATMFLVAELIGKSTSWMTDVPDSAPLMTADAIRSLSTSGINFGSHTLNHVRLSQCSPEVQKKEIFDSKARLEDLLGEEVVDFCYPFGDYDANAVRLVAEAGYQTGLTCERAIANYAPSPFLLPRKAISYGDWFPGFWWKLHMKNQPKRPLAP